MTLPERLGLLYACFVDRQMQAYERSVKAFARGDKIRGLRDQGAAEAWADATEGLRRVMRPVTKP